MTRQRTAETRLFVRGAMRSDLGRVRSNNEDSVACVIPREGDLARGRGLLALVADGMGGHAAGEVASLLAAETVLRVYFADGAAPPAALAAGFAAANRAIYERSRDDPVCAGMGTTCTAIALVGDQGFLAHVGDSRAYLLRDRALTQISHDDSLVGEMVRMGKISPEEARHRADRNVILKALGTAPSVEPAIWREGRPLRAGDVFVLCSDGLSDLVENAAIGDTIARLPPAEACEALIASALAAGGHDNVSVGVFAVSDAPPSSAALGSTRTFRVP
ncbi:MAG: protein phosphatase 2C domain-containing protein [Alphaproteobacteria bacterium]